MSTLNECQKQHDWLTSMMIPSTHIIIWTNVSVTLWKVIVDMSMKKKWSHGWRHENFNSINIVLMERSEIKKAIAASSKFWQYFGVGLVPASEPTAFLTPQRDKKGKEIRWIAVDMKDHKEIIWRIVLWTIFQNYNFESVVVHSLHSSTYLTSSLESHDDSLHCSVQFLSLLNWASSHPKSN